MIKIQRTRTKTQDLETLEEVMGKSVHAATRVAFQEFIRIAEELPEGIIRELSLRMASPHPGVIVIELPSLEGNSVLVRIYPAPSAESHPADRKYPAEVVVYPRRGLASWALIQHIPPSWSAGRVAGVDTAYAIWFRVGGLDNILTP